MKNKKTILKVKNDILSNLTKEQINQLVVDSQKGSKESFVKIYENFYVKVFRYIYVKCSNVQESENLTQEVFIKAFKSISSFKFRENGTSGPSFSSWIFTIARNQIIDYYRKNSSKTESYIDNIQEEYWSVSENLEDELDNKLQFNKIIKNMEKLTSLQKEVINLRFAAQMSLSETAKILNKNENSIKSLQHSAIKKLRDILND
ncbi:MAG: hypothetical protein CL770_00880 [Chloroflexi bacterium]|nr:hypothetical protein [Chloroflexota bacterium]|tara:strand:+ start:14723 stop:15334 length:612 start_codon:yes stop_codon:yes gene_type:complete